MLIGAKTLNNKESIEKATCKNKELWKGVKELEKGSDNTPENNGQSRLVLEDESTITRVRKL